MLTSKLLNNHYLAFRSHLMDYVILLAEGQLDVKTYKRITKSLRNYCDRFEMSFEKEQKV